MNRRNFLSALIAAPLAAKALASGRVSCDKPNLSNAPKSLGGMDHKEDALPYATSYYEPSRICEGTIYWDGVPISPVTITLKDKWIKTNIKVKGLPDGNYM